MRSAFLPFALPDVDETELFQIKEALESGWVTTGPKTRQFEGEFARFVGGMYAVAVNSCTAAMHLALEAIGLKRGDEVITTPYTFGATAEVVRYFDANPVLVDILKDDFTIDPDQIEAAVTEQTRAIIPVHIAGLPAEMDALADIAARHNLSIIEDAAHAFPCRYKGQIIGSGAWAAGRAEGRIVKTLACFSFYATKPLTTGEGGMIVTNDKALAERCRIMALHGISKDAWNRYMADGSWYYEIIAPGYKYNMTDIAAGMGLAQLQKAERMWRRRTEIAGRYNRAFGGMPEVEVPRDRTDCQHAWHLYMLRLNLDRLGIDRARFMEEMRQRNIGTSVHFIPLHLHPYYRKTYGYAAEDFPVAYREYLREVSLPIYSRMTDEDVQDVIESVIQVIMHYAA